MTLTIETRLGCRVVDRDGIVHFPRGLAGLETEKDYVLLAVKQDAPLLILQSVTNRHIGLLVADPYSFLESYQVVFGEAERALLRISSSEEAAVLVTVSIPSGEPDRATLNLTGPIVINHAARLGLQIPQRMRTRAKVDLHTEAGRLSAGCRHLCFQTRREAGEDSGMPGRFAELVAKDVERCDCPV